HAAILSFIGSMIPVSFILFTIRPIFNYLKRTKKFRNLVRRLRPITRQQALNIIKADAEAVGVGDNVGTHTLRKTWGYHAWKS
ncbi:MAG TPA: hypothetical protein VK998_00730, partial [Schnuerera sp.]|nr:hypothetical protein [Schnuerera sp.]